MRLPFSKVATLDDCQFHHRLDVYELSLLKPCRETARLDRYLKGPRHSLRRLFSLFYDLLRTWCASTG